MKKYVLIVLISLSAFSCTQEASLTVSPDVTAMTFGPEGGSFNTILFTNGSSWSASCDDPGVSVTPSSGSYTTPLHIEVGENTELFTKAIRITFDAELDGKTRVSKIVVTQGCHPFVICKENVADIEAKGGTARFHVNSNVPWVVTGTLLGDEAYPLSVNPMSHGENQVEVEVEIPANTGGRRTFSVILAMKSDPGREVLRLIVNQD